MENPYTRTLFFEAVREFTNTVRENTPDPGDHCSIILHNPVDDTTIPLTVYGDTTSPYPFGVERVPPGIEMMAGFGPSPNSIMNHRIYKFKIPKAIITYTETGARWLHFASPPTTTDSFPYDATGPRINTWPPGVIQGRYDTYGIIILASPSVGGEIALINTLALMAPWIALTIAAITIGFAKLRRKLIRIMPS